MPAHPRGFGAQLSVLRALIVRDALMRFGHENLGFFWVILEPLMFGLGVTALWTIGNHTHGQVSTVIFVISGYSLLTMFRHIVSGSIRLLSRNLGLRFHANVKPLDIFVARALLESLACLSAFYVAYVPLAALQLVEPMRDPLLAMGAWGLGTWFCASFGLILAGLSEFGDVLERVLPVSLYLTIPLTGVFTMQSWLPAKAQYVLSWSPFVNVMEMFRGGMFSADVVVTWDAWYVVWCCFALTVIGLLLFDHSRNRAQME